MLMIIMVLIMQMLIMIMIMVIMMMIIMIMTKDSDYACFRPFNAAANTEGPPQVIIKVSSKPIKVAILKQRKNLPKPTGQDKKYILVEDLTPASHKMLTAISKSKMAEKVWTIDGAIKYTIAGQQGIKTVKSVFDPLNKVFAK